MPDSTSPRTEKVDVREDPSMTRRLPQERPARVTIALQDGSTVVGEAGVNRGDDASPYCREELRGKFMDLTGRVWPAQHAQQMLEVTLGLGDGGVALSEWTELLQYPPAD